MDQDTDLFVQAFWAKCREVIRPEIDATVDSLRRAGHDANVSTQEFSPVADSLPAPAGPSVKLALRPADVSVGSVHLSIQFQGDVPRQSVDVLTDGKRTHSFDLAALGAAEVRAEIGDWLSRLAISTSV